MAKLFLMLLVAAALLAEGAVTVDFDAATGPAVNVGDTTVRIDIATDGSASLNSISSIGISNAAAVVSGSVSSAPSIPYTVTLFIANNNGRQTSIGLMGVANNHIDPGETMQFSFNLDPAPAGSSLSVTEVALDPDLDTADGSITDSGTGSVGVRFSGTGREAFETSTLDVAGGIQLNGGTVSKYQFAALSFDVTSGTPSDPLPTIGSFSASPVYIPTGGTSTISWEVSDADWVSILPELGRVPGSGSSNVMPMVATEYQLIATNSGGSVTGQVGVVVGERPMNVLFIAIDDMKTITAYHESQPGHLLHRIYPDPVLRSKVVARMTPNMDRLAGEGVAFLNSQCAVPACNPSRASLMTGIRPHVHGMAGNEGGIYFRDWSYGGEQPMADAITLPELLKNNGWYTAETGKIFHSGSDRADSDYPRSWSTWSNVGGGAGAKVPSFFGAVPDSRFEWGQEGGSDAVYSQLNDYAKADFMARVMEQGTMVNGSDVFLVSTNQPFFLACGIFRPHTPYYATKDLIDLFPTNEMTVTRAMYNEFAADGDDLPGQGLNWSGLDGSDEFVKILDHGIALAGADGDLAIWKDMLQHYFASCALADRAVGRLLDGLENSPFADNTMVILWSDHGYHLGEKLKQSKFSLWDDAANQLLLIKDPRNPQSHGLRCFRAVNLVDLYPTVAAMAGLPLPDARITGHDLTPLLENPRSTWNIPTHTTYGSVAHNMVRMERFKLIRYNDDNHQTELYDLDNDPEEFINLADSNAFGSVKAEMIALLNIALAEGTYPNEREGDLTNFRFGSSGHGQDAGTMANAADPDRDGLANIHEFSLGTDPLTPDTGLAGLLPALGTSGNALYYEFRYRDSRNSIFYQVEARTNLLGGTSAVIWDSRTPGAVDAATHIDHGDGTRTLRVPADTTEPARFLRQALGEAP
ncbi:Arylsulfatase [Pontiella desulfatans]|uniref:Arylsulfatase n=1 Tax=Pontiella desulfatans TaxID=2750659 RepID=A0A6C2U085_PONDE|nr:sulfatase-like hydrolase/transferase [Pontiella desulfatans]SPS73786.1 sulfatase S1_7 [Kiritimatiellales bacterium]VGO13332.1 Arylsulfatase [Pontiella desulfatans]